MKTLRLKFYALTDEQVRIIRESLIMGNKLSFTEWQEINSALKYPSVGMQTVIEENLQLRNRIQALELKLETLTGEKGL